MNQKFALSLLLILISCGGQNGQTKKLEVEGQGHSSFLVMGLTNQESIKAQAQALNLEVEGDAILKISGDADDIRELQVPVNDKLHIIQDSVIEVTKGQDFTPDRSTLFQAKREFGLVEYWKTNPTADGRNVVVGVLDDGISPNQSGFKVTSDGKRKFLKKGSRSSFSTFAMTEHEDHFWVTIDETRKSYDGQIDYNQDKQLTTINAKVSKDGSEVCIDLDTNGTFSDSECRGTFSATGQYFNLPAAPRYTVLAEVDLNKKTLQIIPTEKGTDSHGEGVASVLAGHRIGNIAGFDGVAPGAQILDYDLSEETDVITEDRYTIGTFLRAFEWFGQNGAEVVNVSYSLFFTNVKAQAFMAEALDSIVKKYNMVISFSAGNNGPGLGSLNRRSMYPNSILVAGAYVSPQLDEQVHGVTGLPEEGRVVFYSSRGPGPGGIGPMLIAPLGSLTHSTSDGGFRAFSGTSSASPALAGAATVLISALKQEGLKIDATTVVHALRLSGKQLKNEPFVAQGYGLPQVEKAVAIYKKLALGEQFMYVDSTINKGALDGVTAKGIIIKKSESGSTESRQIGLTSFTSPLAAEEVRMNLVLPIDIEYSNGIRGPRELWIGGASKLFIDINVDEMLNGTNGEAFGELRLKSKLDGSLIGIVPVTIIDDQDVRSNVKAQMEVTSHGSERLHINVPEGIKGFRVRTTLLQGSDSFLELSVFDTNYQRVQYTKIQRDFWVSTPKPGHYQVALNMNAGTSESARLQFDIETLQLVKRTNATSKDAPKIIVKNNGQTAINGIIKLSEIRRPLATAFFDGKMQDKDGKALDVPEVTLDVKKGTYYVSLSATQEHDMSYVYSYCYMKVVTPDGKSETKRGTSVVVKAETAKLTASCTPFDWGIKDDSSIAWSVSVSDKGASSLARIDLTPKKTAEFTLPKVENPGTYEVYVSDMNSSESISLGTVEIY